MPDRIKPYIPERPERGFGAYKEQVEFPQELNSALGRVEQAILDIRKEKDDVFQDASGSGDSPLWKQQQGARMLLDAARAARIMLSHYKPARNYEKTAGAEERFKDREADVNQLSEEIRVLVERLKQFCGVEEGPDR